MRRTIGLLVILARALLAMPLVAAQCAAPPHPLRSGATDQTAIGGSP